MTVPARLLLIASFAESVFAFRGELISSLERAGIEVHCAVPAGDDFVPRLRALYPRMVVHCVPMERTGMNPVRDVVMFAKLWLLMRSLRPGFVLAYTAKPIIYGAIAAWLARVPRRYSLVTGVGFLFSEASRSLLLRLVVQLYGFALSRCHGVFFQNRDDQALFRNSGLLDTATPSVVVNGSGVDLDRFTPSVLPAGAPSFLMVCRLLRDKGVVEYAEAAARIKEEYPNISLVLAGWIDRNPAAVSDSDLSRWCEDGGLVFLGRLADVRDALRLATVYVLPSYREGTPRTVLEAMAMGRPIITTDAPGCRETVIDGENGFLVPVKSVDALVEAMLKFIDDPTLAPRMGKRSREIAEEKYDVHKVNAVMLREMGITPIAAEQSDA